MAALPVDSKLLGIHLRVRPTAMGVLRAILPDRMLLEYCRVHDVKFRNRFFTPLLTFWTFIAQCLEPDHSCRAAVARATLWWRRRKAPGQVLNRKLADHSQDTGAYCRARERLPEDLISAMARWVGRQLDERVQRDQKMWGRNVYLVDATCVSMPDTPELAREFGRSGGGKAGAKQSLFPIGRLLAFISLASGAVIDASIGAYRTSERALFRSAVRKAQWLDQAIIVGDAIYGAFPNVAWLLAHGADIITRPYSRRKVDLRKGKCLGPGDRLVVWQADSKLKPLADDDEKVESLTLRLIEVRSLRRGFRPKRIIVVTTLTDPKLYSAQDIANLYLRRWEIEVDLRHLKSVMDIDILRGQSPDIVRKEMWAHLVAYNLIRSLMWEAANSHNFPPSGFEFQRNASTPEYLRTEHRKHPMFALNQTPVSDSLEGVIE